MHLSLGVSYGVSTPAKPTPMKSRHAHPGRDDLTRYWPFGVLGLVGPVLAVFVGRWMPFYISTGATICGGFATAVWVFQRGSGRPLTAGLVSGLAAGLIGGGLAFLFPWA
jgi:hypothetical protein